jgi:hypothetical protein
MRERNYLRRAWHKGLEYRSPPPSRMVRIDLYRRSIALFIHGEIYSVPFRGACGILLL